MSRSFTFIHAADIHLDSPLNGLAQKDAAFSDLVRGATRRAFANVVDLAIAEGAAFVVIAGDLYDGAWKDQSTGQFALAQMARLTRHGIRAVIALGNHDAESKITRHLTPPDGVFKLRSAKCETVLFDEIGVAIHGRSYKEAATTENISATYAAPVKGHFNVALLHTALDGHPNHAPYAPCSVDELKASGHDYWALGHVHDFTVRSRHPHIVYPGNTQGRHVRETGAKGAVVVRVQDGQVVSIEHRPCDEVRWAHAMVDASTARDVSDVLAAATAQLQGAVRTADRRPLATRLSLTLPAALASQLAAGAEQFEAEMRGHAAGVSDAIWIERIRIQSANTIDIEGLPPEILSLLADALEDPDCLRAVEAAVRPLLLKLPPDLGDPETEPLLVAARTKNPAALVAAGRAAVAAHLGLGEDA